MSVQPSPSSTAAAPFISRPRVEGTLNTAVGTKAGDRAGAGTGLLTSVVIGKP